MYIFAADLVRLTRNSIQWKKIMTLPQQDLYPVYDALNAVSAVPWNINHQILDVAIEMFNKGGNATLKIPPPISALPEAPKLLLDMPPEEKMRIFHERVQLQKEKKEVFSLWCTELYKLSIANKYRNDVFWFPHNLDFRGRSYAIPPHFNHLGGDLSRSILVFAKGRQLMKHDINQFIATHITCNI